jgi:hypothetical protein
MPLQGSAKFLKLPLCRARHFRSQFLISAGKAVMECVIETEASTILQFIHGLGGDVYLRFGLHSRWRGACRRG